MSETRNTEPLLKAFEQIAPIREKRVLSCPIAASLA